MLRFVRLLSATETLRVRFGALNSLLNEIVHCEIRVPRRYANGMKCGASDNQRVRVMPDASLWRRRLQEVVGGTGIEPVAPPV